MLLVKSIFVFVLLTCSVNSQTLWHKYPLNPVLGKGTPGYWDGDGVYAPAVVLIDTIYKMFYAGYNGTNYEIGLANSADKINWTRHFSVPVLEYGTPGSWDARYVTEPSVMFMNGLYKMWYTGSASDALELFAIGYAISVNGTNWDKHDFNPVLTASTIGNWDPEGVSSPSVIVKNGVYFMWFTGLKISGSAIGFASSPDGINWNWYEGNPVLEGDPASWDKNIKNCKVLEIVGNYLMWYTGINGDTARIGYAYSENGIDWTKYSGNPVLDTELGTWEHLGVAKPEVLYTEGEYLSMWYSGFDNPNNSQIGFANEITIDVENEDEHLITEYNLNQNYPNPFNPSTTIKYQIPELNFVTIKVYDVLGNEITALVNEEKPAGSFEVEFSVGRDSSPDIASGIYFYRIQAVPSGRQAGNFIQTKKMLLLK